tara:strand:- start:59 stop:346 length:288 start_codon:yes stop_codon:yes gene_type:complete
MVDIPIDDGDAPPQASMLKEIIRILCHQLNVSEEQLWSSFKITFAVYAGAKGKEMSGKVVEKFESKLSEYLAKIPKDKLNMESIYAWIQSYTQDS